MPQHLLKVTPEYAKKWFNVVIGTPISPSSAQTRTFGENVSNRFTTGGGAVIDQLQGEEPVVEEPPQSNGNLF